MPLETRDVKRFNKEASKKNPSKYVAIFNGALEACRKSDGKLAKSAGMEGCDQYAAMTANAKWRG